MDSDRQLTVPGTQLEFVFPKPWRTKRRFWRGRNWLGERKIEELERRVHSLEISIGDIFSMYSKVENRLVKLEPPPEERIETE